MHYPETVANATSMARAHHHRDCFGSWSTGYALTNGEVRESLQGGNERSQSAGQSRAIHSKDDEGTQIHACLWGHLSKL